MTFLCSKRQYFFMISFPSSLYYPIILNFDLKWRQSFYPLTFAT